MLKSLSIGLYGLQGEDPTYLKCLSHFSLEIGETGGINMFDGIGQWILILFVTCCISVLLGL